MLTSQAAAKGDFFTPTVKSDDVGTYLSEVDYDKIDMILESHSSGPVIFVNNRVLTTFGLVAITFLITIGGPTGSEAVISSAGPLIGMLAFMVYPLVYAAPYAYIVAELCSIFPEDGGFAVWVLNAFGPFWGFQVGFWSWVSCVFTSALLPGLILNLFTYSLSWDPSTSTGYLFKAMFAVVFASMTLMGTRSVSRVSNVMMLLVFASFLIFTVWAYTEATDSDDLLQIRHESTVYNYETKDVELSGPIAIEWAILFYMLYFNFSGVHIASVFGGEVSNPARAYPRGITITLILTVLTCLIPIPAALCSNNVSWTGLDNNSYVYMGLKIGGSMLEALMVLASVCSFGGQYMATLYAQSFMIMGMAENELVPLRLGSRNATFNSPHVAIVGTMLISLALLNTGQSNLIVLANTFSVAVELLIVATAIHLRRKLPYVARPTKVPGGVTTLYAMGVLPATMFGYMVVTAVTFGSTAAIMAAIMLVGGAYGLFQSRHHRLSF